MKREGKLHWPGAAQYPTMINPRLLLIRLGSPVNVRESKTRHYFKTTGWFSFWLSVSVVDQGVASARLAGLTRELTGSSSPTGLLAVPVIGVLLRQYLEHAMSLGITRPC